ncbi:MAG: putative protein YxeI [Chlamydiae bacterium]|nr:putative protein YxeI [Chlamydiota bacterium]
MIRFIASILLLIVSQLGFSCSDFILSTAGNGWVSGRSLEFSSELDTKVTLFPSCESLQSIAPGNQPGLKWTSKYAYIGISCAAPDNVIDGLNEKGMSISGLWLPTTQYQEVGSSQSSQALAIELFGKWVLGNFATVAELQQALPDVKVWEGNPLPTVSIPPLHFSIHDATGASIVIEFVNGQQKVYENWAQVLTNYPTFDWQLTNLQNHINLKALNSSAFNFNGQSINFKGQGSGMLGVPGDLTPPSRFVRLFYFKRFTKTPDSVEGGVNLAFHLLNTVDIPYGVVQERVQSAQNIDYTQWVVVKDLTNQVLYIRTYQDQNIYKVSFDGMDPSLKGLSIPINQCLKYSTLQLQGS